MRGLGRASAWRPAGTPQTSHTSCRKTGDRDRVFTRVGAGAIDNVLTLDTDGRPQVFLRKLLTRPLRHGHIPVVVQAKISVEKLQSLHKMMHNELEKISKRTTKIANKKRSEGPDFQEGEKVYLLRKNIKTRRQSNKLDHTKIRPYRISRKLGPVTFELGPATLTSDYPLGWPSIQ